jgi:hypothetical protein
VSALVLAEPMMGQLASEVLPDYDAIADRGPGYAVADPGIGPAVSALADEDYAAFVDLALGSGRLLSVDHPARPLVRAILTANAPAVGKDTFAQYESNLVSKLSRLKGLRTLLLTGSRPQPAFVVQTLRNHGLDVQECVLPTNSELINIEQPDVFNQTLKGAYQR